MTLRTTIEINHDLVIKQEVPFSAESVFVIIEAENIQEFVETLTQRIQDAAKNISALSS